MAVISSNALTGITTRMADAAMSAGSIVQIVQTVVSTHSFSTTSTSKTDISGMSVAITPSSANNKVLISTNLNYGGTHYSYYGFLLRGSTELAIPSSGYNPCSFAICSLTTSGSNWELHDRDFMYLDSPSTTSATTYKLQIQCQSGGTWYLNRTGRNGSTDCVCSSSITAMEVAV